MTLSRILLVEDDITLADWISEYLIEQEFIVKHVARGDLVLDAFTEFEPNLVLLDVMLWAVCDVCVAVCELGVLSAPMLMRLFVKCWLCAGRC